MNRRALAVFLACGLSAGTLLGTGLAGCGGDGGGGPPPAPALTGIVRLYTDQPGRDVQVQVEGGPVGLTRIDGLLHLGPVSPGPRVLRVGDSVTTPTLLVPFQAAAEGTFLERPVHLPDLASGVVASLPATITTTTVVAGDELPGVSLTLAGSSSASFPQGFGREVRLVGVSPSRLPVPVPGAGEPRAAFLVEPHGASFSPPATLTVPRLDDAAAGPFDAYRVSLTTGEWELVQSGVAAVGSDAVSFPVDRGTLYAVVPSAPAATVDVTGRVVAGAQPLEGFRVSCWNRASEPTDADGLFVIRDVPTSYGAFLLRAYPARPGVRFAPDVIQSLTQAPMAGDVSVAALPVDNLRPTVQRTRPDAGAGNVDRRTQIVVTFSEPIDRSIAEPFRVVGLRGRVRGRLNYDNAFTVRLVPAENLDPSERYTIVIDSRVQDLSGNRIDDATLSFAFETRGGAPDPPPTDTVAFGISPLRAAAGDTLTVLGRNFTGGSQVTFGGFQGLVTAETTDTIEARVPGTQPAGDVTLSVSAGGMNVATLRPLVLDLRATVATVLSGSATPVPLAFLDRDDPPTSVIVDGENVGGTSVTIDGVSIGAVDSTEMIGGVNVATGRALQLSSPIPDALFSGPLVVRGANGEPSATYRFIQVRE